MAISFFSIMMSVIWVSIVIVCIYLLRTISFFNIKTILYMYVFCMLRMCVPVEFKFTKVVNTPKLYNWIYPTIKRNINFIPISLGHFILLICCLMSLILLTKLILEYIHVYKTIHLISHFQDNTMVQNLKKMYPEFNSIDKILISTEFPIPMQIGLIHPIILLPPNNYDSRDLYYIIKHELVHFQNHDTWIKLGINIWKCFFWWFPLTYLLNYELDESLEIKCDCNVIKGLNKSQKTEYLTALLHVYETQGDKKNNFLRNKTSTLFKGHDSLINRFKHISLSTKKNYASLPIVVFFTATYIFSYLFIFQSFSEPVCYDENDITYFSENNSYLKLNQNGKYELYINDMYSKELSPKEYDYFSNNGFICK